MFALSKILTLTALAATLAVGTGCSTDNMPLRPEGKAYSDYAVQRGPGPGTGCNRNPPPSQC